MAELFQITVNFLASVVVWSLRNNKTARQFISFPNVDPIDTFKQLDSLYFQQTEYTKGSRLMKFFKMTRERGERLPVFLARLEAARTELRTMFKIVVSDDDFKSVMQENLPTELISLYHTLNRKEQQASLADIRLELISLEASIVKPSIEAHFNEYVKKDYDQKRDRSQSPRSFDQRDSTRKSISPGITRDKYYSRSSDSRNSPSKDDKQDGKPRGNSSWNRRREDDRDKSYRREEPRKDTRFEPRFDRNERLRSKSPVRDYGKRDDRDRRKSDKDYDHKRERSESPSHYKRQDRHVNFRKPEANVAEDPVVNPPLDPSQRDEEEEYQRIRARDNELRREEDENIHKAMLASAWTQ